MDQHICRPIDHPRQCQHDGRPVERNGDQADHRENQQRQVNSPQGRKPFHQPPQLRRGLPLPPGGGLGSPRASPTESARDLPLAGGGMLPGRRRGWRRRGWRRRSRFGRGAFRTGGRSRPGRRRPADLLFRLLRSHAVFFHEIASARHHSHPLASTLSCQSICLTKRIVSRWAP